MSLKNGKSNNSGNNIRYSYVYTVDHRKLMQDRKDAKTPELSAVCTGKVCHRINLIDPLTGEKVPQADLAAERKKIRDKQHKLNAEYLLEGNATLPPPGNATLPPPGDAQLPPPGNATLPVCAPMGSVGIIKPKISHDLNLHLDKNTGNTTAIFGSSKMGKSSTLMYIYKKYYSGSDWITIAALQNPQSKIYTSKLVGGKAKKARLLMIDKYSPMIYKLEKRINIISKNSHNFCNLFDDFIGIKGNSTLEELVLTYRNSNISTVICLQYVNLLAKSSRSNVNNILLFGNNTDEATRVAIEIYLKSWFHEHGINSIDEMVCEFKRLTSGDNLHTFFHIVPAKNIVNVIKLPL
jgi:hypothetical protein